MIAKKLFFTIVALGILFLPFSVVAADKNTMWQQLIEQEGCLLSSTDINYTISGSVFEKKNCGKIFLTMRRITRLFSIQLLINLVVAKQQNFISVILEMLRRVKLQCLWYNALLEKTGILMMVIMIN